MGCHRRVRGLGSPGYGPVSPLLPPPPYLSICPNNGAAKGLLLCHSLVLPPYRTGSTSGKGHHQSFPGFSRTSWTIGARRSLISRRTGVRKITLRRSSCGTCRTRRSRSPWRAWQTFFSKKAWRRNSWVPRVTCLPFQPRHSHWAGWAHFIQTLM